MANGIVIPETSQLKDQINDLYSALNGLSVVLFNKVMAANSYVEFTPVQWGVYLVIGTYWGANSMFLITNRGTSVGATPIYNNTAYSFTIEDGKIRINSTTRTNVTVIYVGTS